MVTDTEPEKTTLGFWIETEKKELLQKLAHERYTSVSDLMRAEVDELLERADEIDTDGSTEEGSA